MNPEDDAEKSNEALKKTAENAARTMVDDIKWLMSSPRGRRLVWWLLDITGVYRTSFSSQRGGTEFNEGGRNTGLKILAKVQEHCLDRFVEMLREQGKK